MKQETRGRRQHTRERRQKKDKKQETRERSYLPPLSRFCAHLFLSSLRFTIFDGCVKKSGVRPALVFHHIVSLLVCFISHSFASVSHPKFLLLQSETGKTRGSVSLFCFKKFCFILLQFCFISLQFRFEGKFETPYLTHVPLYQYMFVHGCLL